MVARMEVLRKNRDKIVALNSDHGDPVFQHRATMLMHEYFRIRLQGVDRNPFLYGLFFCKGNVCVA